MPLGAPGVLRGPSFPGQGGCSVPFRSVLSVPFRSVPVELCMRSGPDIDMYGILYVAVTNEILVGREERRNQPSSEVGTTINLDCLP